MSDKEQNRRAYRTKELRAYLARRIAQLQTSLERIKIEATELSSVLQADGPTLGIGPSTLESLTDQLQRISSRGVDAKQETLLFGAFREWMLEDPGGPSLVGPPWWALPGGPSLVGPPWSTRSRPGRDFRNGRRRTGHEEG